MALRLIWKAATGQWDRAIKDIVNPMAKAATGAINDARNYAVTQGRAAIAGAGFSAKWQNALRGTVYPAHQASLDAAAWIYHRIPYAGVFETGARIPGSPLLWLPLPTAPKSIGGRQMNPRNFAAQVGPLHSINVPGKPPMLAAYMRGTPRAKMTISRLRAGGALARLGVRSPRSATGGVGVVSVPVFVGVTSVQLHARFNLHAVFQRAQAQLPAFYVRRIEQTG